MAAVGSERRKKWTAIVLTCQNKTNAHTFQKGNQYGSVYVCLIIVVFGVRWQMKKTFVPNYGVYIQHNYKLK